jgi:hypothetical protein
LDTDSNTKNVELEQLRVAIRATLPGALAVFQATPLRLRDQFAAARATLLEAISDAREAFRFASAAERKKRVAAVKTELENQHKPAASRTEELAFRRSLKTSALAAAPVVALDEACQLDRKSGVIAWGCKLGPTSSNQRFVMAVDEVEARFVALEQCP